MVLAPQVNSGSYFNDQDRTSRRVEWLTTYAFTPLGPKHLVKVGMGVTYETFDGVNRSRPIDIVREDGTLSQAIMFTGSGLLDRRRTALRGFRQDSWTVSPRLSVQFGARYDYDSFTGDVNVAPRGSFTATASDDGRTVIRGGAGLFYDPIPLNVTSFGQMQERAMTSFQADGVTPVGPTMLMPNVVASAIQGAIERVVTVGSTQAAEMVKLLENTFRAVNIGLVNEIAMMREQQRSTMAIRTRTENAAEGEARQEGEPMDRVIRLNEVKRITGLSRTTIWEMERAWKSPKHLQLTAKAIGWLESQIGGWIEALAASPTTEPGRRPNLR